MIVNNCDQFNRVNIVRKSPKLVKLCVCIYMCIVCVHICCSTNTTGSASFLLTGSSPKHTQ